MNALPARLRRLAATLLLLAGVPAWGAGVVVWDFENLTPATLPGGSTGMAWLGRSLSESLTATLLDTPGLEVVERQRLKDVLAEQKLSAGDLADPDARLRLGRIIGATRMVFGSYFALGGQVQVSVRVVDTATSRVLFSDELAAPGDAVMEQIESQNRRLVRVLGDGDPAIRRYPAAQWQAYDEALAASDAGRYEQAIALLQKLVAQNKQFTPAERQLTALLDKMSRR